MITIEGIKINTRIHEGSQFDIYRGEDEKNKIPVIIKLLNAEYPTPAELDGIENEYNILDKLQGVTGIVNNCSMVDCGNSKAIVMEDTNSLALSQIIKTKKMNIKNFLLLSTKICKILQEVHGRRIIHKDIKPGNILFNEKNSEVYLIDFGLSTQLLKTNLDAIETSSLQGSIQYISPEQTGRMNKPVDYRTDYYSLGVTFYEMVTGQLPFNSDDPMELVHSHIAITPKQPHEANPAVPVMVSRIIMKLLNKNPEDRYQSPWGLTADLFRCYRSLKKDSVIEAFELGKEDISDHFQISKKVYGREKEISQITQIFDRVALGHKEIIFTTGKSGVGKSAITGEIQKQVVDKGWYFIESKYSQFKNNVPYSSLIYAFDELVKQILTKKQEVIDDYKEKILDSVGENGQIIIDVIPKIELIIGPQQSVQKLTAEKAQNRFNMVFQNFISVFCTREHPLVLLLDNLQWADQASFSLLNEILKDPQLGYFSFLGVYRDNEVNKTHLLSLALESLKKDEIAWHTILVKPLTEEYITQLVEDTIHSKTKQSKQLSSVIYKKTNGNPFFVVEFLKKLYQDGLIYFDKGWKVKINEISTIKITANVVDLMAEKIKLFPHDTLSMLKIAACIGVKVYMDTFSIITGKTRREIISILESPINEGMLILIGANCKFAHDRVQQVVYSLVNKKTAQKLHYKIGMALYRHPSLQPYEKQIFSIVNHFNLCKTMFSEEEKLEVINLNMEAGKKAKDNNAWEAAVDFLSNAQKLLPENSWKSHYKITLDLMTELCEAEYMSRNFDKFLSYANIVDKNVKSVIDKTGIIKLLINYHSTQHNFDKAIKIGLRNLKKLGVSLSLNPSKLAVIPDIIKIKLMLRKKQISDLFNNPDLDSQKYETIIELIQELAVPAYLAKPNLMPIIVTTIVLLSLKYGNSPTAAYSFTGYGFIVATVFGDVEAGYQFGLLSLKLGEKYGDKFFLSKINYVMTFISHWKSPFNESIKYLDNTIKNCEESGEFQYLGIAYYWYSFPFFLKGDALKIAEEKAIDLYAVMAKLKQPSSELLLKLFGQFYHNLLSKEDDICTMEGDYGSEKLAVKEFEESRDITRLGIYGGLKLFLYYLFGKYDKGFQLITTYENYIKTGCRGITVYPWFYFIAGLTLSKLLETNPKQPKLKKQFKKILKMFKKWGKDNPINYGNKLLLLLTEKNKTEGKSVEKTIAFYDLAIAQAKKQGFIHEEAIANELASLYCYSKNLLIFASHYMNRAHFLYKRWGSMSKARQIENLYPQILKEMNSNDGQYQKMLSKIKKGSISSTTFSSTTNSSTTSYNNFLDIVTVLKANQTLSGEIEMNSLLKKMLIILVENAGAEKGFLILNDEKGLTVEAKCLGKDARIISQQLDKSNEVCTSIINYVVKTKEFLVLGNATKDTTFNQDEYIRNNKIKSVLCLPIIKHKQLVAILYLENNLSFGAFTQDRVEMLKIISTQAAISIQNARLVENMRDKERLKEEMKIAERIQVSLCATPPTHNELEIAASMQPAEEVGGDYYDIIFDGDNNLWFAIGDVSGHGVTAGLVMMMAETLFNSQVKTNKVNDPAALINNVNRILFENVRDRMGEFHFMTMTFLKYEGKGKFTHAGLHIDIIIWRNKTKTFEIVKTEGIYLGILADVSHATNNKSFILESGDVMLLYTDGIIEARTPTDKLLEPRGLMKIMQPVMDKEVHVINDTIVKKTLAFCHNKPADDITMIVVKMK